MDLRSVLTGAVVMGPMTKGSNLPYRRLAVELGARVLVSEMTVARRLKQKRQSEFALIRRGPNEPCFGVQLAGTNPEEMAWAAALVEARGADFVDINLGCPIDHFTRKGMGAALGRQPSRVRRMVETMAKGVGQVPITVKIRLGWNDEMRNHVELARAAVDGGAQAVFVHGRTRDARYRRAADWDAIGEVAAAVPVPVVGNGDLLFPHEIDAALAKAGCAGVMVARGALIKPWLFRELTEGYRDLSGDERARDLSTLRRARDRALAGRRAWPRHGRRIREVAPELLVPLRATSRRRLVAVDAGARVRHMGHVTARSPARARRRRRACVARRTAGRARRDRPGAGSRARRRRRCRRHSVGIVQVPGFRGSGVPPGCRSSAFPVSSPPAVASGSRTRNSPSSTPHVTVRPVASR